MAVKSPERPSTKDTYSANHLRDAEHQAVNPDFISSAHVDNGIDELEKYANNPENHSGREDQNADQAASKTPSNTNNIDRAREAEEGGWRNNFKQKVNSSRFNKDNLQAAVKQKGPMGLLIAIFGGSTVAIGGILSPALLLVQLKTIFTNDLSDATPAVQLRSDALLNDKIGGLKATIGICGKVVTIRCKFRTISAAERKAFEDAGFKVEGDPVGTGDSARTALSAITMPEEAGGGRVTNPSQLDKLRKANSAIDAAFRKVFSPATPFINKFFQSVLARLNLSKAPKLEGNSEDDVHASEDTNLGVNENADASTPKYKAFEKISAAAKGLQEHVGKSVGVQLACTAFDFVSAITTGMEIAKITLIAGFAMQFLVTADQLMAGNGNPATISTLSTQATAVDPNQTTANGAQNPDYNKAATESNGYTDAAYGESNPLPKDLIIGGGALYATLWSIKHIINTATGGTANTKLVCKIATDASYLQCVEGPVAVAVCAAMLVAGPAVISPLVSSILKKIIESTATLALTSKTVGPLVGNAMFVGTAGILSGMATAFGMKPASASEFKHYLASTDEIRKQDIAYNVYEAKSHPLDIYDQYSFLGSIASNLNLAAFSSSSIGANITQLYSMIPLAFSSVGSASAAIFMPATAFNANRFNQNANPSLQGFCDADVTGFCRSVMPDNVLSAKSSTSVQYMVDSGHIADADLTGAPKSDDYAKFLQYCGPGRVDPWGETSHSITDGSGDDTDWFTGVKCTQDSTELQNFRTFTMDNTVEQMIDSPTTAPTTVSGAATAFLGGNNYSANDIRMLASLAGLSN